MMERYLAALVDLLGQVNPGWAYAVLGASALVENVFPPIPGDAVVVFAAYLVGRGHLSWLPVYVATCLGGTAGFLAMYYLGRSRGRAFVQGRGGVLFRPERLERVEAWLARRGIWLILGNRFLSGVRSAIALGAGIGGMDWRTVSAAGLASMALWNGALLCAGHAVGQNWERATTLLSQYNTAIGTLLAAAVLVVVGRRWRRSRG